MLHFFPLTLWITVWDWIDPNRHSWQILIQLHKGKSIQGKQESEAAKSFLRCCADLCDFTMEETGPAKTFHWSPTVLFVSPTGSIITILTTVFQSHYRHRFIMIIAFLLPSEQPIKHYFHYSIVISLPEESTVNSKSPYADVLPHTLYYPHLTYNGS
jgi:hypothetical protein